MTSEEQLERRLVERHVAIGSGNHDFERHWKDTEDDLADAITEIRRLRLLEAAEANCRTQVHESKFCPCDCHEAQDRGQTSDG